MAGASKFFERNDRNKYIIKGKFPSYREAKNYRAKNGGMIFRQGKISDPYPYLVVCKKG